MERSEEAQEIIRRAQHWSLAVGLIPVPWVDVAAITYVQVGMIEQLCTLYAVPYREDSAKALVTALVGSLLPTALGVNIARSAMRYLPGIGPLLATLSLPATLGGSSAIVGKLVAQHFEAGGDLSDFGLKVRSGPSLGADADAGSPAGPPQAPPAQGASAPTLDPTMTEGSAGPAKSETPDDLTEINGVGPKIAALLRAAKVTTFAQIADMSPEEIRQILDDAGPRYRSHDPSSWPMQARAR